MIRRYYSGRIKTLRRQIAHPSWGGCCNKSYMGSSPDSPFLMSLATRDYTPPLFVATDAFLSPTYLCCITCGYVKQEAPKKQQFEKEGLTNEGRHHLLLLCKQVHDKRGIA